MCRKVRYLIAVVFPSLMLMQAPSAHALGFEGTRELPLPKKNESSEVHLAINPLNPLNIAVVAKNSGPKFMNGLRSWYSLDGGSTWAYGPQFGGSFESHNAEASDPVVAFGPDGRAFYAQLIFRYSPRSWQSLLVLRRSSNGGATFSDYGVIVRTKNGAPTPSGLGEVSGKHPWNDKEWITVDQTSGPYSGRIYAAWDRILGPDSTLMFNYSSDGGLTFTSPVAVEKYAIFPQIVVRADGTVDLLWVNPGKYGSKKITIRHAKSTNGGASFTAAETIAEIKGKNFIAPIPTLAVNSAGRLVACWQRLNWDENRARAFCSSSDGTGSWSSAFMLAPSEPAKLQELPTVASQGPRFWATLLLSQKSKTSVALYRSDNGGLSFTKRQTLASHNYGYKTAGFVGDYMGLATTSDHIVAAYVLGRDPNHKKQSAYVSSVFDP